MPTTLGAPMPPAAVPHVPLRGAPSPARTPGACGGQLGHVPGGPIFRLPLRFIGAAAVGRSSEEAGASSGWLGAPVCGGDTQSRRHRGAGCVRWPARRAGWLAGWLSLRLGLRRRRSGPCPARRRAAGGGHCLACECTSLTCKSGRTVAPRGRASRPARARAAGAGAPGAAALPRAGRAPPKSLLSSPLHWRAQEPNRGAPEGNGRLVPSCLCALLF